MSRDEIAHLQAQAQLWTGVRAELDEGESRYHLESSYEGDHSYGGESQLVGSVTEAAAAPQALRSEGDGLARREPGEALALRGLGMATAVVGLIVLVRRPVAPHWVRVRDGGDADDCEVVRGFALV